MKSYTKLICITILVLITHMSIAQNRIVTGKVIDSSGNGVVNATVLDKKTKKTVSSDENGNFKLPVSSDGIIVVSSVGYERQEFPVKGRSEITVPLRSTPTSLNDVVVTALGVRREKRNLIALNSYAAKILLRHANLIL